jgi:hypothetical protein
MAKKTKKLTGEAVASPTLDTLTIFSIEVRGWGTDNRSLTAAYTINHDNKGVLTPYSRGSETFGEEDVVDILDIKGGGGTYGEEMEEVILTKIVAILEAEAEAEEE